ncbi:cytochrome c [Novosphingobium sp. TH158]|uniref:c-type cytochrome n=1 Tax=Novosphingobium sp. TH158 TaxID=2067455 RepID=UPI000C7AEB35|nr:cytochrome c [Novosphingobium sp. TH158]PLK24271.1 hypothetical protein C0V78_13445 [Novosphingobium sp. TH158]
MKAALPLALLSLILSGTPANARALSDSARRGLALGEARCAACHGVTANATSPEPEAPTWQDIANRPGTTSVTLRRFLRDSHNYPAAMKFTMKPGHIRDLANYIATLKRKGYKPEI